MVIKITSACGIEVEYSPTLGDACRIGKHLTGGVDVKVLAELEKSLSDFMNRNNKKPLKISLNYQTYKELSQETIALRSFSPTGEGDNFRGVPLSVDSNQEQNILLM